MWIYNTDNKFIFQGWGERENIYIWTIYMNHIYEYIYIPYIFHIYELKITWVIKWWIKLYFALISNVIIGEKTINIEWLLQISGLKT